MTDLARPEGDLARKRATSLMLKPMRPKAPARIAVRLEKAPWGSTQSIGNNQTPDHGPRQDINTAFAIILLRASCATGQSFLAGLVGAFLLPHLASIFIQNKTVIMILL